MEINIEKVNYIEKWLKWVRRKISPRQFLIFSSILVGTSAGFASVVLKYFVHFIKNFVLEEHLLQLDFKYIYLFFPLLGIGIATLIVQRFFKGDLHRGTTYILFSVAKRKSFLPFSQMYSHIITSAITVGFGGSAGLESPIVSTGSAIGSNFAQRYKLSYKERTLLLAAGAAGGIAGAFNAPIAGVLFALEVLLIDINITAFIPLLIAAASGTLVSKIILKENILLSFKLQQPFDYYNVPVYIILGILAGAVSIYHVNFFDKIENKFESMGSVTKRWLYGGILLAVGVALFPSLFGEGYQSIKDLAEMKPQLLFKDSILSQWIVHPAVIILFVLLVMLFKAIAVGITLGSGGNGGNFAPALFVGAYLGFVFGYGLQLLGFGNIPVGNLTLVAMAGILSGVFHAPLTAIFLIAEITGGYELIIPLMLVSCISYVVVKYFHPESLEVRRLKKSGTIISEDRDTSILGKIEMKALIETNFTEIKPGATLRVLVDNIKHSQRNTFPVVNEKSVLVGLIFLDEIKEEMFDQKLYDKVHAKELMHKEFTRISIDDDIFSVMKKFEESGEWNLPVTNNDLYMGFISKSNILAKYREELLLSK